MKRLAAALVVVTVLFARTGAARAQDAKAVVDKAIAALGGEDKLSKAGTITWKTKSKMFFNGNEGEAKTEITAQGIDRYRAVLEAEFNGNAFRTVTVLDGNKGWRDFRDQVDALSGEQLTNTKRIAYIDIVPVTLVALKGPGFKLESAPDENAAGKPASVLKVTGPDNKTFKLYFDKETGLPARMVGDVVSFRGEYTQDTTYSNYKDFGGIKKATKVEDKRDGETFRINEITEFKVLEKAPADAFTEPK